MAPGVNSSKSAEEIHVKKLSEICPDWLQIPTKYYETLGTNIRGSLFCSIGRDYLTPEQLTFGTAILNLFQLSAVILDDICDDSEVRRSQQTVHEKYGREKALVWSLGLCSHIHEYIRKEAGNAEMAKKMIQLYDRMSSLTLEGQYYDLDRANTNFKQIAELKTAYYTTCFPVAILVLMKTNDLDSAFKVMHNESLLEIGYFFQAENDFKGTFLDSNTDILNKTWTLLIQMLAHSFPEGSFEYPETKEESIELYKKYDIYDAYVRVRQDWLKRLKKMSPEKSLAGHPELEEIVQKAKKFSLSYFSSTYILKGYTFKNPDLSDREQLHPQGEELIRQVLPWAHKRLGVEPVARAFGATGAHGSCNWVNKAFPFIKEFDTMLRIHKMNIMCLVLEDIAGRQPGLIEKWIDMAVHESAYPPFEVRVVARDFGDDGPPLQPLFWEMCSNSRELAKDFRSSIDRAPDRFVEWLRAVLTLKSNWNSIKSMEEYYKLAATARRVNLFYNYGAMAHGHNIDFVVTPLVDALGKYYVLQEDFYSYTSQLAAAKAADVEGKGAVGGEPQKPIYNSIEMYKKLYPKKAADMVVQDIVDDLHGDVEGVLMYIRSFKGTDTEYLTVMMPGMSDRVVQKYEKEVLASKNSAWVNLAGLAE